MKAYLTFARRKDEDVHMLGIDNPENICDLLFVNLKSGQPILPIIKNNKIIAFYLLDIEGNLHQLYGDIDYLFELDNLLDLTIINLNKYNLIKYFVSNMFQCLSIQEAKYNLEKFECLEEKIFYDLLHIEVEYYRIKQMIAREISKSDIDDNFKLRFLTSLKQTKNPNKKTLNKKIDIDLSGYSIYINSLT